MIFRGVTLDAAAQALGIGRRMVAYYEQGEKPIPRVVALATRGLDEAGAWVIGKRFAAIRRGKATRETTAPADEKKKA